MSKTKRTFSSSNISSGRRLLAALFFAAALWPMGALPGAAQSTDTNKKDDKNGVSLTAPAGWETATPAPESKALYSLRATRDGSHMTCEVSAREPEQPTNAHDYADALRKVMAQQSRFEQQFGRSAASTRVAAAVSELKVGGEAGTGFAVVHGAAEEYHAAAVKGARLLTLDCSGVDALHGADQPALDALLAAIRF